MSRTYLRLARLQPIRGERDELLDVAEAFSTAAESGAMLARAAETSTDPRYVRQLAASHAASLMQLPIPSEEVPPEAA